MEEEDSKDAASAQPKEDDDEFVMHIEETKPEDLELMLKPKKKPLCADDFETINFLGEGAYAKVVHVRHKATSKSYALKIILKKHMKKVPISDSFPR